MRAREKGSGLASPDPTPTAKKGPDVIIQKRGESGTRAQASPDPHTTHSPKRKVQGVCK
jgi:hypothetical protein